MCFLTWHHFSSPVSPIAHKYTLAAVLCTHLHMLLKKGSSYIFFYPSFKAYQCDLCLYIFLNFETLFLPPEGGSCAMEADRVLPAICWVWNFGCLLQYSSCQQMIWCLLCLKGKHWKFSSFSWRSYYGSFLSLWSSDILLTTKW